MAAVKARYREARARKWLSWLARQMQAGSQTVFLIEDLQPAWLTNGRQLWAYALLSRTAGAIAAYTLFFAVVDVLMTFDPETTAGASDALAIPVVGIFLGGITLGGITGIIVGLAVIARFDRRRVFAVLAGLAATGLVLALILLLLAGASTDPWSIDPAAAFGLAIMTTPFVVLWTARLLKRTIETDIHLVESLRWSWSRFRERAFTNKGCWWVLLLGPLWLLFLIIRGVLAAYTVTPVDRKTLPNQGVRLSLRNALFAWGSVALLGAPIGMLVGSLAGLGDGAAAFFKAAGVGTLAGAAGFSLPGIFLGFWFGGLDVVHHYVLRFVLYASGAMPLRCARFLDHAADNLGFLQHVGGGYMFVHRYLLEHFARMEPGEGALGDAPTARQPAAAGAD